MTCPRCRSEALRLEYEGKEEGLTVWCILHCTTCSLSWRDTEPKKMTQFDLRNPAFRVDPNRPDRYPAILMPH